MKKEGKNCKKQWIKPEIEILKFNKTLGGSAPNKPEGPTYGGSQY